MAAASSEPMDEMQFVVDTADEESLPQIAHASSEIPIEESVPGVTVAEHRPESEDEDDLPSEIAVGKPPMDTLVVDPPSDIEAPPSDQFDDNLCVVCKETDHRYKCPSCLIRYCSLKCFKVHKDSGPCEKGTAVTDKSEASGDTNRPGSSERTYYFPSKDTVPEEKLKMLSSGDNLVQLREFMQDPRIRDNILKLDTCANPVRAFQEVMENDDFVKFSQFVTTLLNDSDPR